MRHTCGPVLKKYRENAGLTQTQAAKALGYQSGQFISNIESGKAYLPLAKVKKASGLYKIKPKVFTDLMVNEYRKRIETEINGARKR